MLLLATAFSFPLEDDDDDAGTVEGPADEKLLVLALLARAVEGA